MSGLVEARRFRTRMEAEIARTFLNSEGIHAVLFDADSIAYADGFANDVRLMVVAEELDEALDLLERP